MTETLYLDLFFLVNLAADCYLLFLTGLVLREPVRKRKGRLLLGAVVGAAAGCALVFFPNLPVSVWILLELVLPAVLMTRAAFGRGGLLELLRRTTVLWMAAALTGGSFSLLESAGGGRELPVSGNAPQAFVGTVTAVWEQTPWTFRKFGLALSVAGGALWAGTVFLRQGMVFHNSLYEATLYYQGKQKTVRALRDTGNQLYEPYHHQPVHILERSAGLEFGEAAAQVIYVPFCSVGKEHGILAAVRMDRMEIRQRGRLVRVLENPWVAFCETPLSARHRYEMLLHGELTL